MGRKGTGKSRAWRIEIKLQAVKDLSRFLEVRRENECSLYGWLVSYQYSCLPGRHLTCKLEACLSWKVLTLFEQGASFTEFLE